MYISNLSIKQFRNYQALELNFEKKTNLLIGENAQGKTNILEAIYCLAMAKSHRTTNDKDLIQWQQDFAKIEGMIEKENSQIPLELVISKKGKKAKLRSIEQRRLSDYVGHMNVVIFSPVDLDLVKGQPQIRRRFLDMEIGQISPVYLYEISQYYKVLQQRNAHLKSLAMLRSGSDVLLQILTSQLIELAVKIITKRFEFLEALRKRAAVIHHSISRSMEQLEIAYQSSVEVLETHEVARLSDNYHEKFAKIEVKEIDRGVTLIGPHRDDLVFYVNNQNVLSFGSQGQQRTVSLSLKLAEIDLIHHEMHESPIVLLDDVLSELDDYRQAHLLDTIQGKVQTFITTTSIDGIHHQTLKNAEQFTVHNGEIFNR